MVYQPEELEKMKKTAGILLVVLGCAGLFLGFFYIQKNINSATALKRTKNVQKNLESIAALQFKDTDKDGLSDYEELYLYGTSPYLEDTDSDGANDKEEILSGEDPNCPKGQNCFESTPLTSPTSEPPGIEPNLPEVPPEELTKNPLENLSMEDLRNLLKKSGLGEDVLQKISDEDLQKMYEETLKEIQSPQ